jgi:hypothetical protein
MKPLTFRLVLDSRDALPAQLAPCEMSEISPAMWDQLAGDMSAEPTLMPSPASLLASRCREGHAAAAIVEGSIISYIALVPIVGDAAGAPSWATLAAGLVDRGASLPEVGVCSFTNSWTAPGWRRRGISLSLRPALVDRYLAAGNLGILDMDGLASLVPAQLGWRIVAWDRVPFLSSLVSLPASEFPEQARQGWTSPLPLRRYQGPHVPLDAPDHPWARYFHFWASDVALAELLDQKIRDLSCGDLHRWRAVIVKVFAAPEVLWKVAFDND